MSKRPMPPGPNEDTGLPREVYALLAQANLLRIRGCWDDAVRNCMEALRLAPDSPSAQSLLGDIYENQGRVDDAIQWYRMALDANPESPADHLKLDRLLQRQQPSFRAERKTSVAEPSGNSQLMDVSPTLTTAASSPHPLWSRFKQDPETSLRYGARLAAVLVCLVVVLAYAAIHRRAALATLGLASNQEVKTAPVVLPPPSGPAPEAKVSETGRDVAEQAVLSTLRNSSDLSSQGIAVDDVQFDPRSGHMGITVSLTAGNNFTRAFVLRNALRTAEAGAEASPSAAAFTVRCLMASATQAETAPATSLVFVGDVSPDALPGSGKAEPDDAHVLALFTNPWWSPQLPG